MLDLIVPGAVVAVLTLIVWLLRKNRDPQVDWRTFAERHDLQFTATGTGGGEMMVEGLHHGTQLKLVSRYRGAGEARQVTSELTAALPECVGRALVMTCSVSLRQAKKLASDPDRHDLSRPLIWQVSGVSTAQQAALTADPAVRQRMTNLLVVFPESTVSDGHVRVPTIGTFTGTPDNVAELACRLALDIARVCEQA